MHRARMGKRHRVLCPFQGPSPNIHMFTNLEKLYKSAPFGGFITETWLINSVAIGGWVPSPPLYPLRGLGWDSKFHQAISGWFPRQPAQILKITKGFPKVINIMKNNVIALSTENPKGFWSCEPETRGRSNIYFLL